MGGPRGEDFSQSLTVMRTRGTRSKDGWGLKVGTRRDGAHERE